jgi:hypothetical protein
MATFTDDVTLKYQTTVDGDMEETTFSSGDEVDVVQKWDSAPFVLIKDGDGHFYNVPADKIDA